MPKGYGYDKAPKKASGFRMKGFSYPGASPIKGKAAKRAVKRANAREDRKEAYAKMGEFDPFTSSQLEGGMSTTYVGSPLNNMEDNDPELPKEKKKIDWQNIKGNVAEAGLGALVSGGIQVGVNAIQNATRKKERREVPVPTFGSAGIGSASKITQLWHLK